MKRQYFDQRGRELSAAQALDARGLIRNGVRMRIGNVTMIDPRACEITRPRIVDGHSRLHGLHQPG